MCYLGVSISFWSRQCVSHTQHFCVPQWWERSFSPLIFVIKLHSELLCSLPSAISSITVTHMNPRLHYSALFCEGQNWMFNWFLHLRAQEYLFPTPAYDSLVRYKPLILTLPTHLPVFLLSDTLSCASTSTSRWNPRWLRWTYPNKNHQRCPVLLFPLLSLPSNLLRASQRLPSALLGWK